MKQKVMTVELCTVSADARTYYVAELMLPAQGHEIRDALQQVRFPEVSNTFHEISVLSCPVLPQLVGLRLDAPTVQELAYFANRVNDLPIDELIVLKGVFQRFVEDESLGEVVSMKDLINMTYGLENVMVAANVTNDTALGQFVIENGLHQNVADVPDESVFLLDKALIGKLQRESDQGIYVDGFYVVTCDYEIPEVYNGITLPEPPQDDWYAFQLKISESPIASPGDTESIAKWIRLPISKAGADEIARSFREERIEDCAFYGIESSIPQITEKHFFNMKEFEKLNRLAYNIMQMSPRDQAKFKAALELEVPEDMDGVLDVADNLDQYSFAPLLESTNQYFKEYLSRHSDVRMDIRWLDDLSCYSEGDELLAKLGGKATLYGVISARGRDLYEIVPRYEEPAKTLTTQKLTDEKLEVVEVLGQTALFTNGRVTQMELPDGLYCYELRSGENMAFATVEPHVRSDFAGSLLFKAPLDFGGAQYIAFNEETVPNFLDYDMTPEEFMSTDFSEDEGENMGMGGMEL